MPRPKRTKVASTTRVAPTSAPSPPPQNKSQRRTAPAIQATREKSASSTEDSQGFVRTSTRLRGGRRLPSNQDDYMMTGALPEDETPNKVDRTRPAPKNATPAQELADAPQFLRRGRGAARKSGNGGEAQQATTSVGEEIQKNTVAQEEEPTSTTPGQAQDPSLGDLEADSLLDTTLRSSLLDGTSPRQPPSALKVRGTPAVENSMLALANFKRRPRQPSILRMVQTDSDDDDNFDYLDDFNPDDESTPLKLGKSGIQTGTPPSDNPPRTSSSRKRKLSTPEVQVPRSSPPPMPSPSAEREGSVDSSGPSSLPAAIADTQEQQLEELDDRNNREETPVEDPMSETMAPPLSSSPIKQSPIKPTVKMTIQRGRPKRLRGNNGPDEEADGQETGIANTRSRRKQAGSKPVTLYTATLQSLLPKRRNTTMGRTRSRNTDAFDIPSSTPEPEEDDNISIADSEDELQNASRRTTISSRRGGAGSKSTGRAPSKTPARKGRSADARAGTTAASAKSTKTYSRRISSDKENEAGEESSFLDPPPNEDEDEEPSDVTEVATPVVKSKELESAAQKFKEVDDWEMEFESVDMSGGSTSSPWR